MLRLSPLLAGLAAALARTLLVALIVALALLILLLSAGALDLGAAAAPAALAELLAAG